MGGPCITPTSFKGAHPHALAVISHSVAYMVQCHSSTIGVGTSGKVGAFCIKVVGQFTFHSDTEVIYPFHSPLLCFCMALPAVTQFSEW